jgi:hypothetical protein
VDSEVSSRLTSWLKGKALADELGSGAEFVSTDVTDEDSVREAIQAANNLGTLRYGVVAHGGWGVAQGGGQPGPSAPSPRSPVSTGYHARRLGRMTLAADNAWDVLIGTS